MVDSSVWIDYFNGRVTAATDALERLADRPIIIGDLIMAEVLQGFRREEDFRRAQRIFAPLVFRVIGGRDVAIAAAKNYRLLRARGATVRTTIDSLIASFCVLENHELLHCDREFDPFRRYLGLRVTSV